MRVSVSAGRPTLATGRAFVTIYFGDPHALSLFGSFPFSFYVEDNNFQNVYVLAIGSLDVRSCVCVSAAVVPSLPTHRFLFIFLYRNVTFSYVTVVRNMFSLLPILGFVCELRMGFFAYRL